MAEATSITCNKVIDSQNGWQILELKSTASTTETITIPTSGDGSQVSASSKVVILSATNLTAGTVNGSALSITYSAANRRFTYTETGKTDQDLRIIFMARDE